MISGNYLASRKIIKTSRKYIKNRVNNMNTTVNPSIDKTLLIAIIEDDNFFTEGLIMALSDYFKGKNKKAIFITGNSFTGRVDIIFQTIRCGTVIIPHCRYNSNSGRSHYFAIVDDRDSRLQKLYRDVKKSNVFSRHESVDTLLQLIERKLYSPQAILEKSLLKQQVYLREPLTPRELEVLYYLKQGKTHTSAANCMGISVKTISSHKRAAMKKLNFKRSNELFHWMLQGGLSRHESIKENY
jgi:DNA-binding CsgD family transcriptional regulator